MGERLVDAQRRDVKVLTSSEHLCLSNSNAYQKVEVPSAAAAAAASRILEDASVVFLDAQNNANDRAYLPDPAHVPMGKVYLLATDGTGCELSTEGVGTTINGVVCTDASSGAFSKELALAATTTFTAVKTGANAWSVSPGTAAPDA